MKPARTVVGLMIEVVVPAVAIVLTIEVEAMIVVVQAIGVGSEAGVAAMTGFVQAIGAGPRLVVVVMIEVVLSRLQCFVQ